MGWNRPLSPTRRTEPLPTTAIASRSQDRNANEQMRVLPPAQRQASLPSLGRADLQPVLRRASNGPDRLPFQLRLSGLQQRVPAQAGRRSVRAGAERVLQGAVRAWGREGGRALQPD